MYEVYKMSDFPSSASVVVSAGAAGGNRSRSLSESRSRRNVSPGDLAEKREEMEVAMQQVLLSLAENTTPTF